MASIIIFLNYCDFFPWYLGQNIWWNLSHLHEALWTDQIEILKSNNDLAT